MKKLLWLLLALGLLTGCRPAATGEPDLQDIPEDVYVWEDVGAAILLPEGTVEHCDVTVAKDSGAGVIRFAFKEGGDAVFWLKAYEKGVKEPLEEQLGVFTLGETDTHILQVMTSTCGTLNNEEIRPLWDEMREKVWKMTAENIIESEQ